MKIGIITDIHGNIIALNSVLKNFEELNVEKIICCGDTIGIGPEPEKVVQKLISLGEKIIIVRGNHENYLLKGLPEHIHDDKRRLSTDEIENHRWIHNRLSEISKEFLSKTEDKKYIEIESKKIYVQHYPTKENGAFKMHIKQPTIKEIEELFKPIDADIYLYGHTHETCINQKQDKYYINAGSLGCPLETNKAKAGILEINNGEVKYNQLEVEYDVDEVIKEIKELQFPFYLGILEIFYGNR